MLDAHAAEIASYLGASYLFRSFLRFRIVNSSVHKQINLAVGITLRHHLYSSFRFERIVRMVLVAVISCFFSGF